MHWDESESEYVFTSGRRMYCHAQIIGIDPDLGLTYGYDGGIDWPIPDWWEEEIRPRSKRITAADMAELSDEMINRWTRFKATLQVKG